MVVAVTGFTEVLCVPAVSARRPQPYQTDLSYLEDQFQLIETLVKARKSETSEDSYLLRPDQRRPEAALPDRPVLPGGPVPAL